MVMDFTRKFPEWAAIPQFPIYSPGAPMDTAILDLKRRIKALETLLAAAKQYDKDTGQPDCESAEKEQWFKDLKSQLNRIEKQLVSTS